MFKMNSNRTVNVQYDGFQTQFRAIMETILQTAVREATKLFEVSLQHLKAELVQLRKENANTTTGGSSIPVKRRNTADGSLSNFSKYRDVGVQCGMGFFLCIFALHVSELWRTLNTSWKLNDLTITTL